MNTTTSNLDLDYQPFFLKFQRDLNRVSDSDRNTRKRGLQNLLDTLPWNDKNNQTKNHLNTFVNKSLIEVLIITLTDSTEKCRELVLKIIQKIFESKISINSYHEKIIRVLCSRIDDAPFIEPSEELRLIILQLLSNFLHLEYSNTTSTISSATNTTITSSSEELLPIVPMSCMNLILITYTKALYDSFPNIKRESAENIHIIANKWSTVVQMTYKTIITALVANGLHQHSKTRIITLKVSMHNLFYITFILYYIYFI